MDRTHDLPGRLAGSDDYISIKRASAFGDAVACTLCYQAFAGNLATPKPAHDLLTTRHWLHRYLTAAARDTGRRLPLPTACEPPE